jgi:cytochrome c-type biogenesis protein CcmH
MRYINGFSITIIALGLLLIFSGSAVAQDNQPTDDEVNAVAKGIYCPVCENTPLDVCPTQVCAQWRELIREQLAMGWTEAQIRQYFVDQYGDRVLATPPAQGLNWLVYVLPPIAILAGAFILFRTLRNWKKPLSPMDSEVVETTQEEDEYIARLESELRRR